MTTILYTCMYLSTSLSYILILVQIQNNTDVHVTIRPPPITVADHHPSSTYHTYCTYIYISSIPRRLSTSQTGQQFGKTCSHLRLPIPASTAHATTTSHTDHSEHLGGYLSLSQRAGSSTPPYRPNEISQMSFRAAAAATAATPIAALTDTPPASVAC